MLTLFSIPKPFKGHIGIIQNNAINSWVLLDPRPEIILFGDEEGTSNTAEDFKARHITEIFHTQLGTPLVNDIFEKAQVIARNDTLCYINCDIILMNNFLDSIKKAAGYKKKCLIIGRRWDLDIKERISFSEGWEQKIRHNVSMNAVPHPHTGIDYFVFPRGLFESIPPFAIGRTSWDNWLVYYAVSKGIPVIDISHEVVVVHQNHDYSHIETKSPWKGEETYYNFKLAGNDYIHLFDLRNATYRLRGDRIKR